MPAEGNIDPASSTAEVVQRMLPSTLTFLPEPGVSAVALVVELLLVARMVLTSLGLLLPPITLTCWALAAESLCSLAISCVVATWLLFPLVGTYDS